MAESLRRGCPECRGKKGYEHFGSWFRCMACAGTGFVIVDECPSCGTHVNQRPDNSARRADGAREHVSGLAQTCGCS